MPILLQSRSILYIGVNNKLITLNVATEEAAIYDLPPIKPPENLSKLQEDLFNEQPLITTLSISMGGSLLAVSTHNRQVVIYKIKDVTPISNFVIGRAASKTCFDHEDNIIVADKTGDAYIYKKGVEQQESSLLLGHLSMLLDVQVTSCGQYIITSDRDEKIRVSHYPNSYNILCYCLGHLEFVTNLAVANNQLLSASGDGTVRLWDYRTGSEITNLDTRDLFKKTSNIEMFIDVMNKQNIEVNAIPITNMQVYEYKVGFAHIAITLFQWSNVEIYEFDYRKQNISHVQQINVKDTSGIVALSLGVNLSVITTENLYLFNYNALCNNFAPLPLNVDVLKQYNEVFATCLSKGDVSTLYKRKFDNVQDYLDRKKQRLDGKYTS